MKKIIPIAGAVVVVLGSLTFPSLSSVAFADSAKSAHKAAPIFVYTCTMHPEVLSLKPGNCPKCGMTLVKKAVPALYTCTMHPEVLSLKPGKCPKCGMTLVKKKSGA